MPARYKSFVTVVGILLLSVGCRTSQPELKPATEAEVLRTPPAEPRYNSGGYPKQAFNTDDPTKKNALGLGNNQAIVPTRGSMGPGGGPGGGR